MSPLINHPSKDIYVNMYICKMQANMHMQIISKSIFIGVLEGF
jgi:hypothetical protein